MIGKEIPSILSEVDKWTANGVKFIYPVVVYLDDCFDVEGPSYLGSVLKPSCKSILLST